MKLFSRKKRVDYGEEFIFIFLQVKKRSFLQLSFQLSEYSESPYFQLSMGNNSLLSILFWFYKFGFCIDMFSINWIIMNEDA